MMPYNAALVLLIVTLAAPVLVVLAGMVRLRLASPMAIALTALAFGIAITSYRTGDDRYDAAWVPDWGLRFALALDGLARLYAMLATGIGLAVVIYSAKYLPLHLHHEHRPQKEILRFQFFLLLFMGAMVGLVMAQDLILLFLFWDLTAIASFFLIGFDRDKEESRAAAQMALLVTGISAVFVLIGAVLLWHEHETMDLGRILAADLDNGYAASAAVLIAVAALAKSAQAPLHFWLPNAMAAPTPVSAYLHSAAMVAAGVFLIGRLYPLMERFAWLLDGFVAVGLLSMVVGGILALTRDVLKQILAWSTISQYGYVVFLFGIGGEHGAAAATFYVIAHALSKSALFLTAGAVTEATGQTSLSGVGGLARQMPLLAAGSGAAAAGLIALPLTAGFFKDEFYFEAAWERGPVLGVLAVTGASLTFAYISRFWLGAFGPLDAGESKAKAMSPIPGALTWPVVVLGAIVIAGGIWTVPLLRMAEQAASVTTRHEVHLHGAYHLDLRAANVMALASWAAGIALLLGRRVWWPAAMTVSRIGRRLGPERIYHIGLAQLNRLSDQLHVFEVRDLRSRIASILLPAGILVGIAVYVTPNSDEFEIGAIAFDDAPSILMLALAMFAALAISVPRDHLNLALVLSCVGYSLSVLYAFIGAPNVALVAVLIETVFSLLFIGMLILMPRSILRYETARRAEHFRIRRDAVLATIAGGMAFFVVWGVLSKPAATSTAIDTQVAFTPIAHGKNVVTVILAEFRGLDTMGEITVISIGLLGILSLLRVGRLR
jgi:multicomponent Na+:H+ antiporter subunit A